METHEKTPTFNLKVVLQETGIKPHTLRAWERRYGLPQPERTPGGHRLYSQYDIDTVKWLMARQEEGLTISRAVDLWLNLQDKGENPLALSTYQADDNLLHATSGTTLANIKEQWINACLNFDEATAENVLAQAFAIYPIKMVCVEILLPGVAYVGDLWFQNKASVQQEHFTSALTIKRLNTLLAATPPPSRIGRILVAGPPHEEHAVPLLLFSLLLRYSGWKVIYLGINVPIARLEPTVDFVKPDLVVLAAQQLSTVASLQKAAKVLQDKNVRVAYGGLTFNRIPNLRERIPGYFLGTNLEAGVQTVTQIMTFNPPVPEVEQPQESYEPALARYRIHYPLIELDAWQAISSTGIPYEYIADTNARLYEAIVAALNLGEIDFVNEEMGWTRQLIKNYGVPSSWQFDYFDAYRHAAVKHLNGHGSPIIKCLNTVMSSMEES